MEKRFQQIGTMQAEMASDCPLKAEEIALWLDAENEVLFLTPKMRRLYMMRLLPMVRV